MNISFIELTQYELAAFLAVGLFFLIQLYYYLFIFGRVAFHKTLPEPSSADDKAEQDLPPVSVVICAKNEEENLAIHLPSVLEQDYPNFEVVVVNDCSTDDSDVVLQRLANEYKNLKVTTIGLDPKFSHGKKLALTVGIKAASHNNLLLTDADCQPAGKDWIRYMVQNFGGGKEVVLGYGGYLPQKGWLNKMIRMDTLQIAMQYLGFALAKRPYMGVGRNLAYTKELYDKNRGFASHSHILSGDDDLFIQQVANKKNTTVELRSNGHTRSVASNTFADWAKQKQRHLTTSPLYKRRVKWRLALEPFSRLMLWIIGIYLIVTGFYPLIIASVLFLRLAIVLFILYRVKQRLAEKNLFLFSLAYDLFSPILYGLFMVINRLSLKQKKWK